jgi:hypothetical protein
MSSRKLLEAFLVVLVAVVVVVSDRKSHLPYRPPRYGRGTKKHRPPLTHTPLPALI